MDNHKKLYELFRDCYNGLNFKLLSPHISQEAEYSSQWVLESMVGKDKIIHHLVNKGETITKMNAVLHAEIGILKVNPKSSDNVVLDYKAGDYCVEVKQNGNKTIILLETKKGMIHGIHMCMPEFFYYELLIDEDRMTNEEIHIFGIETVANQLTQTGYKIIEIMPDIGHFPQIVTEKNSKTNYVVVQTEVAPFFGTIEEEIKEKLIELSHENNAIPSFASVSIGSTNNEHFNRGIAIRNGSFYVSFSGIEEFSF